MQKLSIILIMALILGLVPLISSPSTVRAEEPSPIPAVTIAVYTVSNGVYAPILLNDTEKSFNLNGFHGEIKVEVTGDLAVRKVELTQNGTSIDKYDPKKVVFEGIQISPNTLKNLDLEQVFLKIGSSDSEEIYFIGNIPSNTGIAKIQLNNSIFSPNAYYLNNSKDAHNLLGATKLNTNYYGNFEFYLVPNSTVSGSVYIELRNYLRVPRLVEGPPLSQISVSIPEKPIKQGHVNTINIYTTRNVTLNLIKPSTLKDNLDGLQVIYFNLDFFGIDSIPSRPLEKMSKPLTATEDGVVSGNTVTFHDLDLGVWWLTPYIYKELNSKSSFTFGSRVEVKPSLEPDLQINTNVVIKNPATKLDIRDLVTFTSQTNESYLERYLTSMMLRSIQDMFITH
jgi:hypothetical protein